LEAKRILEENPKELQAIALALREKETLTGEEVDQVIASVNAVKVDKDTREELPPSV
jgi:ATP-dependent Zn protease